MDKDFEQWYQKLGLLSMIVYFILSIRYYNVYKTHVSSSELCRLVLFKWIQTYLIAFFSDVVLPLVFDGIGYFFSRNKILRQLWFYLSFR
jgi:hypothetical protein